MKTGMILLVEPEDALRNQLDLCLGRAGHDVASVADGEAARRLLAEGLTPDVVLAPPEPPEIGPALLDQADSSLLLLLDRETEDPADAGDAEPGPADPGHEASSPDAPGPDAPGTADPGPEHGFVGGDRISERISRCRAKPGEVLRRVEELLLDRGPVRRRDESEQCLELSRRLVNALPETRTPEQRIDLLVEGFDTFFGVLGTMVMSRNGAGSEWVEASRGFDDQLAEGVRSEIARRYQVRGVRPFLASLPSASGPRDVACLPVRIGENETNLAISLQTAPQRPAIRESLLNLVGSAVRAATRTEKLEESEARLRSHDDSLESLLNMVEEFTSANRRRTVCERILVALRRELAVTHSAVFLPRDDRSGMLDLQAVSGFTSLRLERIGLSRHHGIGEICYRDGEVHGLSTLPRDGAVSREIAMLTEVGLRWATQLCREGQPCGLLLLANPEDDVDFEGWRSSALESVRGSAAVALRNLQRVERLGRLAHGTVRALIVGLEAVHPRDRGHSDRVAGLAILLGRALRLEDGPLRTLTLSALLHDVGKTGVAPVPGEEIPGANERTHPILGSQMLTRIHPLPALIKGVEQHHERYDGSGHPYGLQGEGIDLFGRILAICDGYDRLTTGAKPLLPSDALRRLERGAGLVYDPGLVALFCGEMGRNPASPAELPAPTDLLEDIGLC